MKATVRFQSAPIVFAQEQAYFDDSASSTPPDNLELMKALNLDEFSSSIEIREQDQTAFEDSIYNRENFAGRTPHSKVVDAKRDRQALQELMKIPPFEKNITKAEMSTVLELSQALLENSGGKSKVQSRNKIDSSTSGLSEIYHFDLTQNLRDGEENKVPVGSVQNKNGNTVRFDEEKFTQSRLETPSANRKIPLRKTPAVQKLVSSEKSFTNYRPHFGENHINCTIPSAIINHSLPVSDGFDGPGKESLIFNTSVDISGISPTNHQDNNFASSTSTNATSSPLANLISRPEVSKSSPLVSSDPSVHHKIVVDAATTYSPPALPSPVRETNPTKEIKKIDAATCHSVLRASENGCHASIQREYNTSPPSIFSKRTFVNSTTPHVGNHPVSEQIKQSLFPMNFEHTSNLTAADYSTPSLVKEGGVAFGKGPLLCKIAHNVVSMKQNVHHMTTETVEIPSLPKVNSNPKQNFVAKPFETFNEVTAEFPKTLQEIEHFKPASNWFSPRNTRKQVPNDGLTYFHQNHLQGYNSTDSERVVPIISVQESTLQQIGSMKSFPIGIEQLSSFPKTETLKKVQICDVSIQVDSTLLHDASKNTVSSSSLPIEDQFILDESQTLEDIINLASLKERQEHQSTIRQSSPTVSHKIPFDLTTCNIGGSPSTIDSSVFITDANSRVVSLNFTPSSVYSPSLSTTIPSILSSKSKLDCTRTTNSSFGSSCLGKPARIPVTVDMKEYIEAVWGNEEEEIAQSVNDSQTFQNEETGEHYESLQQEDYVEPFGDVTILTDVAVANFSRSCLPSEFCEDDFSGPTNNSSVVSTGMETTMTLDRSFLIKESKALLSPSEDDGAVPFPRLAIRSLRRDSQNPFDIKEIGFETSPNELMTIMLTLKNDQKQNKLVKLTSKTIFLRVEPLHSHRCKSDQAEDITVKQEQEEIFTVSPEVLQIFPQEEGMLFITFSPKVEGIYSGVLKISYRKKSFTLLLRGECSRQYALEQRPKLDQQNQFIPADLKASISFQSSIHHSSPETLQSFPSGIRSAFTSSINSTTTGTNNSQIINAANDNHEYFNISPNTFSQKLMSLQKKLGEISRKITLKDTIHPSASSASSFQRSQNFSVSVPTSDSHLKNKRQIANNQIYVLPVTSSHPSSVDSKATSNQTNTSINYQADCERSSSKRLIAKENINNAYTAGNVPIGIAMQETIEIHGRSKEVQQEQANLTDTRQIVQSISRCNHNLVLEEQQLMMKKDGGSSERIDAFSSTKVPATEEYMLNSTKKKGLFFKKAVERFGYTMIGSLVRTKIVLCNATHNEITVYFGDLLPPFYNHHTQVKLRPKSFIRVPIRFIPNEAGEFQQEFIAQTDDGKYQAIVQLNGLAASTTPYKR